MGYGLGIQISEAQYPIGRGGKLFCSRELHGKILTRLLFMLLKNVFFAGQGQGIEFDKEGLDILREAQPGKSPSGPYAVFGLGVNGQVIGLQGELPFQLLVK